MVGNAYNTNKLDSQIDKIADDPLFSRLNDICTFREEHHKLKQVIDVTFSHENEKGKSNFREQALSEMSEAYDAFCKTVQMLDISKEGKDLWDQSKKAYEVFTSRIE